MNSYDSRAELVETRQRNGIPAQSNDEKVKKEAENGKFRPFAANWRMQRMPRSLPMNLLGQFIAVAAA